MVLAVPEGNPAGIRSYEDVAERLDAGSILLAMGNLILFLYDRALGRLTHTLLPRLSRLFPRD